MTIRLGAFAAASFTTLLSLGANASAQEVIQDATAAVRQPPLSVAVPLPATEARGWRSAVSEVPLTLAVAELRGTRFSATVDETVFRPELAVSGAFTVSATFEGGGTAGLALASEGGSPALVVLVRA